jgi:conjugal transfer mating pair stabilization protein TraG
MVAGTTNLMERALSEVIDDNTTDPNAKLEFGAGGHAFDLFLNAVSPRGPISDAFLEATVRDYVRQCYPVARASIAYQVDDDQLFRTSTDLPASFAAMAGPATYSTVYSAAIRPAPRSPAPRPGMRSRRACPIRPCSTITQTGLRAHRL